MQVDSWLHKYKNINGSNELYWLPHSLSYNDKCWEFASDGICFVAYRSQSELPHYASVDPKYHRSVKDILYPDNIKGKIYLKWSSLNLWLRGNKCHTCGHISPKTARAENAEVLDIIVNRNKFQDLLRSVPSEFKVRRSVTITAVSASLGLQVHSPDFRVGIAPMTGPTKSAGTPLQEFLKRLLNEGG